MTQYPLGTSFVMDKRDVAQWQGLLRTLKINVANPMRFLKLAGEVVYAETMAAFRHERSPEGEAWPDLAESTRAGRRKGRKKTLETISSTGITKRGRARHAFKRGVFGSGKRKGQEWERAYKILQDEGELRGSIVQKYSRIPPYVATGSNLPYSRIHQLGGKAGRGQAVTIKRRSYLPSGLTPRMRLAITRALVAQVRAKGAGRWVR